MFAPRGRGALAVPAVLVLTAALAVAGCHSPGGTGPTPSAAPTSASSPAAPSPVAPSPGPPPSGAGGSRPDHVLVVVFENHAYGQIAGSSQAPYLNQLAATGALFENSAAVAHPSEPNYLALFSGSTQGVHSDACPVNFPGAGNLGSQLATAGLSFTGYSEGLPQTGFRGCSSGRYARKHAPWVDFPALPASTGQPYTDFPADFGRLPTVGFVIPDLCHDMHNCSVRTGDDWARAHLDAYRTWAQSHNSLLVVTFDEDDNGPGNHIFTIICGQSVVPGRYREAVDHYRLLRTIEAWYGLPGLGTAAQRAPITDVRR